MKEKQIEQNIREQMLALESQMKRLQKWRDTGYSATICNDDMHNWLEIDRQSFVSGNISVRSKCQVCGIEKSTDYRINDDFFYDNWTDFREGGEEE